MMQPQQQQQQQQVAAIPTTRKNVFVDKRFGPLDLSYITPRVIAMACPRDSSGSGSGRGKVDIGALDAVLRARHGGAERVRVWDLTLDSDYDRRKLAQGNVVRRGFADHHAPPLPLLWRILAELREWLGADPRNVAAVHCFAGRGRTGTVVSSHLLAAGAADTADAALALFAEKRGAAVRAGSQRRYVRYVARHLASERGNSSSIIFGDDSFGGLNRQQASAAVVLKEIRLHTCPHGIGLMGAEIVALEHPHPHVAGQEFFLASAASPNTAEMETLQRIPVDALVSGDVQLRVFEVVEADDSGREQKHQHQHQHVFRLAFNTHFVPLLQSLSICRADLDGAFSGGFYDTRFASKFRVELVFSHPSARSKPKL